MYSTLMEVRGYGTTIEKRMQQAHGKLRTLIWRFNIRKEEVVSLHESDQLVFGEGGMHKQYLIEVHLSRKIAL